MTSLRTTALRHAQCFANILLTADELFQQGGNHFEDIAYLKLQQQDQADNFFQQSLSINRKLIDLEGEAKNWSYIGLMRNQLGDLDGAAEAYRTRIDLAKKLNDTRGEALGGWDLGDVLIKQNKCDEGIELLNKYVEYEKSVGDSAWEQDSNTVWRIEERCLSQKQ